ncbi:MAG TPA: AMP-binding protein, partial [Acidimicrobiales bacterium]|nr:AMP-binding protein [Acidimicrobiales bacterium]
MAMSIAEATEQILRTNPMFEIGEELVAGIPTRVWKSCPPSLRSILELSRLHGGATFLVYEDERITFEEHYLDVAALARVLTDELGVRPGDRVAIVMRNIPEWVVSFWAAAAVGAIIVPLNAWWTGPELAYGLSDSGTKVAFVDAERLERIEEHLGALRESGLEHVSVARADESWSGTWEEGCSR